MEDLKAEKQTLPMGPAASQIAIKQLGTNGGGLPIWRTAAWSVQASSCT